MEIEYRKFKQILRINNVVSQTSRDFTFQLKDYGIISLEDYFKLKYNIVLE